MTAVEIVTLVGAVATVLSAVAGLLVALGSNARRLRNGLTSDVQILPHVRGRTAGELQADIRRRSHLLVASSRFPVITLFDAGLVGVMLAPLFYLAALSVEVQAFPRGTVMLDLLLFAAFLHAVGLIAFAKLTREWSSRAVRRIVYLYQVMGDDVAEAAAKSHSIAFIGIPLLVFAVYFLGSAFPLRTVITHMELPPWVIVACTVAIMIGLIAPWFIGMFSARELDQVIGFYTPIAFVHHEAFPRIRPTSLGGDLESEWAEWRKTQPQAAHRPPWRWKRRTKGAGRE